MKKNILFALLLFICASNVGAQSLEWAKSIDGDVFSYGNSIVTDNSGNIYTTGTYKGTADFDPGPGIFNITAIGYRDFFISKLDHNGNFVWAKSIGGVNISLYSYSLTLDNLGNVHA
jgi:hypothetical protein